MQADFLLSSFVVLGDPAPEGLAEAAADWRELQMWERLLGLKGKSIADTPTRFAERIPVSSLPDRVETLENIVKSAADTLFAETPRDAYPEPAPIVWA